MRGLRKTFAHLSRRLVRNYRNTGGVGLVSKSARNKCAPLFTKAKGSCRPPRGSVGAGRCLGFLTFSGTILGAFARFLHSRATDAPAADAFSDRHDAGEADRRNDRPCVLAADSPYAVKRGHECAGNRHPFCPAGREDERGHSSLDESFVLRRVPPDVPVLTEEHPTSRPDKSKDVTIRRVGFEMRLVNLRSEEHTSE